ARHHAQGVPLGRRPDPRVPAQLGGCRKGIRYPARRHPGERGGRRLSGPGELARPGPGQRHRWPARPAARAPPPGAEAAMTAPRPGLWADYYAPEYVVRVDGDVLD